MNRIPFLHDKKQKYSLDEVLGQEPRTAWGMEVSVVGPV